MKYRTQKSELKLSKEMARRAIMIEKELGEEKVDIQESDSFYRRTASTLVKN